MLKAHCSFQRDLTFFPSLYHSLKHSEFSITTTFTANMSTQSKCQYRKSRRYYMKRTEEVWGQAGPVFIWQGQKWWFHGQVEQLCNILFSTQGFKASKSKCPANDRPETSGNWGKQGNFPTISGDVSISRVSEQAGQFGGLGMDSECHQFHHLRHKSLEMTGIFAGRVLRNAHISQHETEASVCLSQASCLWKHQKIAFSVETAYQAEFMKQFNPLGQWSNQSIKRTYPKAARR